MPQSNRRFCSFKRIVTNISPTFLCLISSMKIVFLLLASLTIYSKSWVSSKHFFAFILIKLACQYFFLSSPSPIFVCPMHFLSNFLFLKFSKEYLTVVSLSSERYWNDHYIQYMSSTIYGTKITKQIWKLMHFFEIMTSWWCHCYVI